MSSDARARITDSQRIRLSYRRLPCQAFWTWLTGKEDHGRKIGRTASPVECAAWAITWYLGGMVASMAIILGGASLFWLIPSMVATVSAARYIVATVIHHGVHGAVLSSVRGNRILCEILSTLTVVQPYDAYRQFHVHEHHGKRFSTLEDKDLAALYTLGIRPGVPVARMRLIVLWQCLSPVFHLSYFWGRIRSNFEQTPPYRVAMLVAWLAALAAVGWWAGLRAFLIGIAIPMTVLYQVCSLLHLLTEHAWLLRTGNQTVRQSHVSNSHARFCGQELPSDELRGFRRLLSWSAWWMQHLLVHLPARLLIVQGSLVVHDWHHRAGNNRNWTQAIQLRESEVQREAAQGLYTYTDIWGLGNVMNEVLVRISEGPEFSPEPRLSYRLN